MKTLYIVLGLQDIQLLNDAYLLQDGIKTESNYYVVGINEGYFDSLTDAMKHAESIRNKYDDGIEIKTILKAI